MSKKTKSVKYIAIARDYNESVIFNSLRKIKAFFKCGQDSFIYDKIDKGTELYSPETQKYYFLDELYE